MTEAQLIMHHTVTIELYDWNHKLCTVDYFNSPQMAEKLGAAWKKRHKGNYYLTIL